jgi:hypothetical protein
MYQSIAQHSKYLPIISRSISNSMLYKVQSPRLKEKLSKLARLAHFPAPSPNHTDVALTESERLSSVIHSRVWNMMQRILFDGLAARQLWDAPSSEKVIDVTEEFTDLLRKESTRDNSIERRASLGSGFDDDLRDQENDEFFDGLKWSEKKGLREENEIEEMLLRDAFRREPSEDELLLTERSRSKSKSI